MYANDDDGGAGLRRRRVDVDGDGALSTNGAKGWPTPPRRSAPQDVSYSPPSMPPAHQSVVPLTMQLMRPFWQMSCCPDCPRGRRSSGGFESFGEDFFAGTPASGTTRNVSMASMNGSVAAPEGTGTAGSRPAGSTPTDRAANGATANGPSYSNVSHGSYPTSPTCSIESNEKEGDDGPRKDLVPVPSMALARRDEVTVEQILREYAAACEIYGCTSRINPGVLTTFRFSLPTLRVSGNFFDADMLALVEVLLKHCNGALSYIKRLDFTIAGKEGKHVAGKKGVRSHGAYALSKVLAESNFIEELYICRNRIGPYGGFAIFIASAENARRGGKLNTLLMRGCRIGERGALAFAEKIIRREDSVEGGGGLREVDLSACRIGFRGIYAIEEALKDRMEREGSDSPTIKVDLEGNMVFQEVMNCVTHGLGILLGTVGTYLLTKQVSGLPPHYTVSCAIYSASIIVLYTSSTLYHSFFALKTTKFIFKVFDKSAIYLLIAGSYSPFLMIALHHEPLWSLHLLLFIWFCAISGILVEAMFRTWRHKSKFSLAMYLGMGWSCLVCLPDLVEVLPGRALAMIVAGGVAYTGGVPFFVRNNNLDHSIWHLFVMAGSIFHWLCVYWYVAKP